MMINNLNRKRIFSALFIFIIIGFFSFLLVRKNSPEIQEITRTFSPSGKLVATVRMTIYGDHWFVNDARYEVSIKDLRVDGGDTIVYSTLAYDTSHISVKWRGDESLVIEDETEALRSSVKQTYPGIRIEYMQRK